MKKCMNDPRNPGWFLSLPGLNSKKKKNEIGLVSVDAIDNSSS